MMFLPIVDRELRISARRRATYWTRVSIALASIVVGGCIFLANIDQPITTVGPSIFLGLSILAICYCLLAGRRLTVESLIDEKNDGTLGLLFLTDLKGHDVILGKMAATSLNAFFSLLALLPVLAIPILMGGVSNGQFWRVVLVLVSTFLFSLALGIFTSATHRTLNRAAGANLLLLLLFVVAIPLVAMFIMFFLFGSLAPAMMPWPFFCTSPVYAFIVAFDPSYAMQSTGFWLSIVVINTLTLLLIYRAGRIVPHSWQDQVVATKPTASRKKLKTSLSRPEATKRAAHRKRLLDVNAFYWLAARDRRKPMRVWWFLLIGFGWWLWGWSSSGDYWFDPAVAITASLILNTSFKLWIALEAGHRLAEDKKSGALELLLSSPLTVRDILRGQWLALRRQFLAPMVLVAIAELLFLVPTPYFSQDRNRWQLFTYLAAGLLMLAVDVATITTVAIYQALVARSPGLAATHTILRVLILPWICLGIIATVLIVGAAMLNEDIAGWKFFLGLWFVLGLLADGIFGLTAWYQLKTNFRTLVVGRFSSPHSQPA